MPPSHSPEDFQDTDVMRDSISHDENDFANSDFTFIGHMGVCVGALPADLSRGFQVQAPVDAAEVDIEFAVNQAMYEHWKRFRSFVKQKCFIDYNSVPVHRVR